MTIHTTKTFDKQYKKLDKKIQMAFEVRIEFFRHNIFDQQLRNHGLHGKYLGYRSIDITGDVRALYTIVHGEVYLFGFIGTHSQLY